MKNKLLLVSLIVMALMCVFAISVSAGVHDNVDKTQTVTLSNGTTVNLFDAEGNALIWYNDASGTLQSIRADDSRVKFKATYGFNVGNSTVGSVYAYEVSDMWIALESGNISKTSIVVFNIMDDDVLVNEATNNAYLNGPVNCVKTIQWSNKVLEYAYLRLDTVAIQQQAFNGCTKLKYINLEDLTELRQFGGSQPFGSSTALFANQTLDLTNTKLISLGGSGAFNAVPFVDIKLPKTLTYIEEWALQGTALVDFAFPENVTVIKGSQFNDCKSLKTIYINNNTTSINDRAFNNTVLEKIFFVGSLQELNALLDNTGANNNAPFWNVVGEDRANLISYEAYQALEDKSGKYVVYNYNYCEAYNEGNHEISEENQLSACAGNCENCGLTVVVHVDGNLAVSIVYASFDAAGEKTTTCQNTGCTHSVKVAVPKIFTCLGYSTQEYEGAGVTFGYSIDNAAIQEYETVSGKTINYGLFLAAAKKLGGNDIFDSEGKASTGVVAAEMPKDRFIKIEIKVLGLDDYKDEKFAIGAYVIEQNDESKNYSYLQLGEATQNDKYYFASYNDICLLLNGTPSQGEENA